MADPKMESPVNVFKGLLTWFKDTSEWIQVNLGDPAIAAMIREDLGLPPGQDMSEAQQGEFKRFANGIDPDKAAFEETVAQIKDLIPQFQALGDSISGGHLHWTDVIYLLGRMAAVDSLRLRVPALYAIAKLLLLISDDPDEVELFNIDMLVKLVRGGEFEPGTAERVFARLIPSVGIGLLEHLLADSPERRNFLDYYFGWDPAPDSLTPRADEIASRTGTLLLRATEGPLLTLSHAWVPKADGGPGLALALSGGIDTSIKTDERTEVKLLGVFPGQASFLIGDAFKAAGTDANGFLKVSITHGNKESPALRLGEPGKTRVDVQRVSLGLELSAEAAALRMGLQGAELITETGGADAFLKSIAGAQARAGLDFGLTIDQHGLRVDGGAGLRATLPVGALQEGPLTVHHLEVGLGPGRGGHDIGLEVSGAFGFSLGPVKGTVDRLGFSLDMSFREGNLGLVDLALGLKPPKGVGLVIDAAIVKGGGYLFMDEARGEYAGALELSIKESISIKAIGVLGTKLPGSDKGWSLLLMLFSEFRAQLPWGFTLLGVGGMVGLQHGMDLEALKSGIRTGALDDILFPKNPVADAPRIINRLRTIFPPTPRALVIGPMVELGWGTPTLVSLRMGLLFQLDNVFGGSERVTLNRLALLGQLRVALPPALPDGKEVLKLLVDFYGYYDFDVERLEFSARLRNSHVLQMPLTGELYVRADFGKQPGFLLAAGGFHPDFKPPAGTPAAMERLGLSFKIGIVDITAKQYYALTPATVQTGSDFRLTAKLGPVQLAGWLGYDALIELEPVFRFMVDMRAGVEVKFKGYTLTSVGLKLHLEGPGRWVARGSLSFSILFWDVEKSFNESWGTAPALEQASTNVAALMSAAFSDKANWRAEQPRGWAPVTLAPTTGETQLLAHPMGQLRISQKVAPLGVELQRMGNTKVVGPNRFDITQAKVGDTVIANPSPVTEAFARSQYVNLTEAQKLSAPAFEQMKSGVILGSDDYALGPEVISADLEPETAYLAPEHPLRLSRRVKVSSLAGLKKGQLLRQARAGAARRAARRGVEKPRTRRALNVSEPPLVAARADTLLRALLLDGSAERSRTLAEQKARVELGPQSLGRTVTIIEAYELEK